MAAELMAANSSKLTQSIENIASASEENSAAVEQVSVSTEEVSASAAAMMEIAMNRAARVACRTVHVKINPIASCCDLLSSKYHHPAQLNSAGNLLKCTNQSLDTAKEARRNRSVIFDSYLLTGAFSKVRKRPQKNKRGFLWYFGGKIARQNTTIC